MNQSSFDQPLPSCEAIKALGGEDTERGKVGHDDELIALCDRFIVVQGLRDAAYKVPSPTIEQERLIEEAQAPLEAEAHDLLDRITRSQPKTPAGLRAIAEVACTYIDPPDRDPANERLDMAERLNASLMQATLSVLADDPDTTQG